MRWFTWILIALPVVLPVNAQSVENQLSDRSTLSILAAATQLPTFAVTLMSAKLSHSAVLGNGIATEFEVTNTGARDVALMDAQIVVKDPGGKVMFRVEWETKKAIGAGQTVNMKSRHASIAPEDVTGLVQMERDLTIDLDVYKIAFADGEVVTYRDCFMCYF